MTNQKDIIGVATAMANYSGNDDPNVAIMHLGNFKKVARALLTSVEALRKIRRGKKGDENFMMAACRFNGLAADALEKIQSIPL
mgnify:FL=1